MEQQQQTKGVGKESQLSRIAAAVNPGSLAEANPTATQSMIATFMKTFEASALELREETNDDQKELIKTMIDEITKLQTKNMKEFEKAIGKIVGITKDLQNSDNPLLQKLGKEMEEKSREEVVKASGYTLTGEKDTFLNRLGRSVGMNTEEEPIEKNRQGIGKLAKGFASNFGRDIKRGFKIAVGADRDQEGTFYDTVVRTDEEKRQRLLSRIDAESNNTQSVSATDTFKKVIEEFLKESKESKSETDSTENKKKESPLVNSEQQEDAAGISKDATIEALQKTADSNVLIQENSNTIQEKATETVEVLKEILELMKKMSTETQGGIGSDSGGDQVGGLDIDLPDRRRGPRRTRGRMQVRARRLARNIRGTAGGIARAVAGGARTVGSAVLRGGSAVMRGVGGLLGFGTAAAGAAGLGGAAGVGTAGAAGAAGLGGAAGAAGLATSTAGAAGAAGATGAAGKIVSGSKSLAAKAGGVLGKAGGILGKGLGVAGRVAGKLALPLAAGMALYDGYKGFTADPNATTGQKFKNAGRNVLSGLTFGLVDSTEDKIAKGEYTGTQKPVQGKAEPVAKKSAEGFFSKNKGMMMGAALGPAGMLAGAAYDKISGSKAETGKNIDGALIEQGTAATKEKMQINVPPPTVINQGGGSQAQPQITFPGGVGKVRSIDPTWLRFQEKRAVA